MSQLKLHEEKMLFWVWQKQCTKYNIHTKIGPETRRGGIPISTNPKGRRGTVPPLNLGYAHICTLTITKKQT